jgi:hypothetical protein
MKKSALWRGRAKSKERGSMEDKRVNEEVHSLLKDIGGKMDFVREGYQYGAWIISLNEKVHVARSNGSGFPDLDQLYVPKSGNVNLSDYRSYTSKLKSDARERLLILLER